MSMSIRERWQLRRQLRDDLLDLRRANMGLSNDEFRRLALEEAGERFSGINQDRLQEIIAIILELLPLILRLFS